MRYEVYVSTEKKLSFLSIWLLKRKRGGQAATQLSFAFAVVKRPNYQCQIGTNRRYTQGWGRTQQDYKIFYGAYDSLYFFSGRKKQVGRNTDAVLGRTITIQLLLTA
ncbi:MAG: hypothetical protein LBP22_05475 [Deltaproteobacteria bacterium]|jgi:hypothetical protein|nr:hypothetical protein [Deltaproteobacteria bacterium]